MTFDESVFLGLSGMALAEYVHEVKLAGRAGLTQSLLERVLERAPELREEHAVYLICWGVHFKIPGVSNVAVTFLNRDAPWHGPQAEILKVLHDADDLTQQHLDAIRPGTLHEWHGLRFPDVFAGMIDELRRELCARQSG